MDHLDQASNVPRSKRFCVYFLTNLPTFSRGLLSCQGIVTVRQARTPPSDIRASFDPATRTRVMGPAHSTSGI